MTDPNPCVLLHRPDQSSTSQIFLTKPDLTDYPQDHVLLQIAFVGVCGSDVHFYTHGGIGSNSRRYAQTYASQFHLLNPQNRPGLVMGHEASATVIVAGSSAFLKPGDNVALEPGNPCRTCQRCVEGSYNLCPDMKFAASLCEKDGIIKQTPGTSSRYYVLLVSLCYKLPDHVTLSEGVFMGPLAVAVHACRIARIAHEPGHNIALIIGVGTIGVLSAAVACAFGAKSALLVDVIPGKLETARNWLTKDGAGRIAGTLVDVYLTDKEKSSEENTREAVQAVNGQVNAVIEASGAACATAMGIYAVRMGGHVVQTGL